MEHVRLFLLLLLLCYRMLLVLRHFEFCLARDHTEFTTCLYYYYLSDHQYYCHTHNTEIFADQSCYKIIILFSLVLYRQLYYCLLGGSSTSDQSLSMPLLLLLITVISIIIDYTHFQSKKNLLYKLHRVVSTLAA